MFQTNLFFFGFLVKNTFKLPHKRLDFKHKSLVSRADNILELRTLVFGLPSYVSGLGIEVRIVIIIFIFTFFIWTISFIPSQVVNSLQKNLFFFFELSDFLFQCKVQLIGLLEFMMKFREVILSLKKRLKMAPDFNS